MLYCTNCGQSSHISEDYFIEYAHISGSETRYLNPETGEVEDYGDTDTTTSGDSDFACPTCGYDSIDFDSEVTEEEALEQRAIYDYRQAELKEIRDRQTKKCKAEEEIKRTGWDLVQNEVLD